MPGASSLKALQYIAEQAPRDGSTIGMFNPNLINLSMLEPNTVSIDFSKLTLLGNMSSDTKVCFAWKGSGIQSADDLRHRPFVIGGTSQGAGFVYGAIMRAVFGDNVKIVLGYPSNSDVWVALERGEADGNCTGWGVIPAMRPEWVTDDKINVLVQFAEKPNPRVPPAPPIYEQNISDELKAAIRFLTISDAIPRPVVAPPGIAADRAAALRQAFFATLSDPDFLAFAKKATLEIDPMQPDVLAHLIAEIRTTPSAAVELAKKLNQQQ
jgi:tripartite-type tricarboxylate transporter receptor subunit TctC